MKENYLERIKKEKENYLSNYDITQEPPEIVNIMDIVTRMDSEIKSLEDKVTNIHANYYQTIEWHEKEIARLKSELAEKPETIKCPQCKHRKYCESRVWFYSDMGNDDFRLSFCSMAKEERKEDENNS